LDSDILDIMDVYSTSGSQDYRMERISVPELLEMRRGASTMVGPARYYATAGANLLMVYPTPTGADELTVYFVPRPVTLAVGSDTPSEIPAEYHPAVEMYALWRLGSMRDDQTSSQGSRFSFRTVSRRV
jgi:hypothetical protein